MVISQDEKLWAEKTLKQCEDKYSWVARKHKDGIPYTTDENGTYDNRADATKAWDQGDGICWWTNGFWGGILWHIYMHSKDEEIAEIAKYSEVLLDRALEEYYGLHHDVGFMWLGTSVANYKLTGNQEGRKRALLAANLLAGRFNLAGNYIRAWNDNASKTSTAGWAIIDCMMNIPLLYWATRETKDPRYEQIAIAHADTVQKTFIREDGSSNHIVEYDPNGSGVVATYGGQGYENGSSWTRGQAWAIYGFVVSYQETKKKEYLETAIKVADYCLSQIPESGLIPIDFCQPKDVALEDSCATAIMVCGLIELAKECTNEQGEQYLNIALKLLHVLDEKRANYGEDCDAILQNCTGSYWSESSHHITMVYADYYYIEALSKLAYDGVKTEKVFVW